MPAAACTRNLADQHNGPALRMPSLAGLGAAPFFTGWRTLLGGAVGLFRTSPAQVVEIPVLPIGDCSGIPPMIELDDFRMVEMRGGTITAVRPNLNARRAACVLRIDFGPAGIRTSSAQVTEHYSPAELVGLEVLAVTNLPGRRIAGIKSEVLVLASTGKDGTVLLTPASPVSSGSKIA